MAVAFRTRAMRVCPWTRVAARVWVGALGRRMRGCEDGTESSCGFEARGCLEPSLSEEKRAQERDMLCRACRMRGLADGGSEDDRADRVWEMVVWVSLLWTRRKIYGARRIGRQKSEDDEEWVWEICLEDGKGGRHMDPRAWRERY